MSQNYHFGQKQTREKLHNENSVFDLLLCFSKEMQSAQVNSSLYVHK
jgi:hypothetical protein